MPEVLSLDSLKARRMDKALEDIWERFIGGIGELAAGMGISRVAAQLYALLYLSNRPLSLDEMVEGLKVSKGNVSLNIRALERWGAVKKSWKRGSRKDYYQAELDVLKIIIPRLKEGIKKRLAIVRDLVEQMEEGLKKAKRGVEEETLRTFSERMKMVKETCALLEKGLEFLELVR